MKEKKLFIIPLLAATITITSCGTQYSNNQDTKETPTQNFSDENQKQGNTKEEKEESDASDDLSFITDEGYVNYWYDYDLVSDQLGDIIAFIDATAKFTQGEDADGEIYYEIPITLRYYPERDGVTKKEIQTNMRFSSIASIIVEDDEQGIEESFDIDFFVDGYKDFYEIDSYPCVIYAGGCDTNGYIESATFCSSLASYSQQ